MATLTCHTPPDTPRHTPPGIQLVDPHIAAATQPSIFEGFDHVSYDANRALLYAGWHSPESVINRITHLFHKGSGLSFYGRTFVQIIALDGYESRKTPEQIKEITGWSDAELSKGKRDAEKQGYVKDCRTHGRGGKQNIKYHWIILINGMMRIDAAKFPEESRQIPFSTNRRNASYCYDRSTDSDGQKGHLFNRKPESEIPFSTNRRNGNFDPPRPKTLPGWCRPLAQFYPHSELMQIAEDVELHLYFPLEESDLAYAARQMAKTYALPGEVAYPDKMLLHIAKTGIGQKIAAAGNTPMIMRRIGGMARNQTGRPPTIPPGGNMPMIMRRIGGKSVRPMRNVTVTLTPGEW